MSKETLELAMKIGELKGKMMALFGMSEQEWNDYVKNNDLEPVFCIDGEGNKILVDKEKNTTEPY